MSSRLLLDDLLTEQELAASLEVTVRTLRRWRALRDGPPWLRIGRQVYYRREAVLGWLRRRERAA